MIPQECLDGGTAHLKLETLEDVPLHLLHLCRRRERELNVDRQAPIKRREGTEVEEEMNKKGTYLLLVVSISRDITEIFDTWMVYLFVLPASENIHQQRDRSSRKGIIFSQNKAHQNIRSNEHRGDPEELQPLRPDRCGGKEQVDVRDGEVKRVGEQFVVLSHLHQPIHQNPPHVSRHFSLNSVHVVRRRPPLRLHLHPQNQNLCLPNGKKQRSLSENQPPSI